MWVVTLVPPCVALPLICLTLQRMSQPTDPWVQTLLLLVHNIVQAAQRLRPTCGSVCLLHVIMRWMLTGCCGLVLIHMSVALNSTLRISQTPRFCGKRTRGSVCIQCLSSKVQAARARWYKAKEYYEDPDKREELQGGGRMEARIRGLTEGGRLCISDVRLEDSGVYFCRINTTWGSGTQLHVARPASRIQVLYQTKMKDALIVLQGLLLAVCIAAMLLHRRKQLKKADIIYEEPENNNIYEDLKIETRGGGLYEELSMQGRPEETEAPWE